MKNRLTPYCLVLLSVIFCMGIYACKNKKPDQIKDQASYLKENAESFSKQLNIDQTADVTLNSKAKAEASNWPEFLTAQSEIQKLSDYNLKEIINNSDNLKSTLSNLNDSLPDRFNTTPIKSRLTVLKTQTAMLNEYAGRLQVEPDQIETYGKAIYRAFCNLKIQINETSLPKVPEFNMDRKQDSLNKANSTNNP